MTNSIEVLTIVLITVEICEATSAVLLASLELSNILCAVSKHQHSLALVDVIDPLTIIFAILSERWIGTLALSMSEAIQHVSLITTAISEGLNNDTFEFRMLFYFQSFN